MDTVTQSPAFVCPYCGRDDFGNIHERNGHFAQCAARDEQLTDDATSYAMSLPDRLQALGKLPGLGRFVETAGAPSEDSTDRDGFLSYHAESHAAGMGISAGFIAATTGDKRLIGVVVGIALYASRGQSKLDTKVIEDIRAEPHYALGAIPLGFMLGKFAMTGVFPDSMPLPGDVLNEAANATAVLACLL